MNDKILKRMILESLQEMMEDEPNVSSNSLADSVMFSQKSDQWFSDIEKAAMNGDKLAIIDLIKSFKKANETLKKVEEKLKTMK